MTLDEILDLSPVVAVVSIADPATAAPLCRALVAGGVRAIEITLRTAAALEAIRAALSVDKAVVGAGTVLSPDDLAAAVDAGAAFAVSPGTTPELLEAGREASIPLLPGVATAGELMQGLARGYSRFKLFPAEAVGGLTVLKAWGGPFPQARFCPTGGITPALAPAYLALPNVACVGGSWLAPQSLLDAEDWAAVEEIARAAAGLGR